MSSHLMHDLLPPRRFPMKATMRDAAPAADLAANPLLLSIEESAAQLRIGRSRMFDLIRRGEVLSVKVGGSRRIPYDSLKDYVNRLVTEQGTPDGDQPAA
jgi:excisionase family DNA binding protein